MENLLTTIPTTITATAKFIPAATIANPVPVLTTPTTVTLKVRNPANTVTNYVYGIDPIPTLAATGELEAAIPINADGVWSWQWFGTGTVPVASEVTTIRAHAGIT